MTEEVRTLLDHLSKLLNHQNAAGKAVQLAVTLKSETTITGQAHAILEDGLAVLNGSRITYIPLAD